MIDVAAICRQAKEASFKAAGYSAKQKNNMLDAICAVLQKPESAKTLLAANAEDVRLAGLNGKDATFIDRLTINDKRIAQMIDGVRQVIALPDPVGKIVGRRTLPNGLKLSKVRAPLGVIGIIYEARPNVTVDAAALCIKSGNAVVLRGSKDALGTNRVLYELMRTAIISAGLEPNVVTFIDDADREATKVMLGQNGLIDVIIPRGGEGLKHFVIEHATMPVIASAGGNCHIYVEKTADLEKAIPIIVNAKIQRPSTCNAAEHLIVDRAIAAKFLPVACSALREKGVEIIGDKEASEILLDIAQMTEEDFDTEFLTYKMSFAVVGGIEEAVAMINRFGTAHSEAILTNDKKCADYFAKNVDAAAVYVNASTRFTDGFEFGMGAEMGISTQKLHARGPVALEELTSVKYVVRGEGHIRE